MSDGGWSSAAQMRAIFAQCGPSVHYPAGSTIFTEGEEGGTMFIIRSGKVRMSIGDTELQIVGENHALGVQSLIDGHDRSTTATAIEDCELAAINRRLFGIMVDEVPNFARYVIGMLVARIRKMEATR